MTKLYNYQCRICGQAFSDEERVDIECCGEFAELVSTSKAVPTWITTPPAEPGVYVVRWGEGDKEPDIAFFDSSNYFQIVGDYTHYSADYSFAKRGLQILSRPLCTDIDAFVRGES